VTRPSKALALLVVAAVAVVVVVVLSVTGEDYPDVKDARAAIAKAAPGARFAKGPEVDGGETFVVAVPSGAGTTRVAVGVAKDRDEETGGFAGRFERALGRGWGELAGCSNWITATDTRTSVGGDVSFDVQEWLNTVTPAKQRCGP
jgi:hypothetical protein